MELPNSLRERGTVAPLAGSVDRNDDAFFQRSFAAAVAPLAGSVDRNRYQLPVDEGQMGRSPRGERG